MYHDKIVPQAFMLLPREIREHLAKVFEIPRTGVTEIRDDQVISDGRTQDDLNTITSAKMADYVGSEESFGRLWELSIAKAKHELYPPVGEIKKIPVPEEGERITIEVPIEEAKQWVGFIGDAVPTEEIEVFEPYKGPATVEEPISEPVIEKKNAKKAKNK